MNASKQSRRKAKVATAALPLPHSAKPAKLPHSAKPAPLPNAAGARIKPSRRRGTNK